MINARNTTGIYSGLQARMKKINEFCTLCITLYEIGWKICGKLLPRCSILFYKNYLFYFLLQQVVG